MSRQVEEKIVFRVRLTFTFTSNRDASSNSLLTFDSVETQGNLESELTRTSLEEMIRQRFKCMRSTAYGVGHQIFVPLDDRV